MNRYRQKAISLYVSITYIANILLVLSTKSRLIEIRGVYHENIKLFVCETNFDGVK